MNDNAPTHQITYDQLIKMVREDEHLLPNQRKDMISALRRFARNYEPQGMGAIVSAPGVSRLLPSASPAMANLSERSFQNMISLLRKALKRYGLAHHPGRHANELTPTWRALLEIIPEAELRYRLSRFMHVASRHGWEPEAITLDHFIQFRSEVENESVLAAPRRIFFRAVQGWNQLSAQLSAWPKTTIEVPVRYTPYTLPWTAFPSSLAAEVRALLDRLGTLDLLSEDQVRPLKPTTLTNMEFKLKQYASALIKNGYEAAQLQSIADLCTWAAFHTGIRFFYDRAGGKLSVQLKCIAVTVHSVAKRNPAVAPEDIRRMKNFISTKLQKKHRGMTEKNQRRVAQFDAAENRDAFMLLPSRMFRAALEMSDKRRACSTVLYAAAIELLIMCPIRISNLAQLDLERHIRRSKTRRGEAIHIFIPAHETKNDIDIHFALPEESARLLIRYIDEFRPQLLKTPCSWLFPARNGKARDKRLFHRAFKAAGHRFGGLSLNPHLFRHIAAKLYLDENPGGYEVVRRTLGHASMDTTSSFYAGQENARAVQHFDRTILVARETAKKRSRGRN